MFNANAINTIDQSTVENEGARYPIISFVNGDLKQKPRAVNKNSDPAFIQSGGISYEGGWFIAADNAPEDMIKFGWKRDSIITKAGAEIEGFSLRQIDISLINQRRRWLVDGQGYPWNEYEQAKALGKPRGHQQFLVLVKNAESVGPFAITLKGHFGMAFEGAKQYAQTGVKSVFSKTVIAAANAKTKPAKWPFRAFWMPAGAQMDGKGQPVFITVGEGADSSTIVVPVSMGLPEKAVQVDLNKFYVGDDLLAVVNQLHTESADWVAQWESKMSNDAGHRNGTHAEEQPEISADDLDDLDV
jgi:hypothetical protein